MLCASSSSNPSYGGTVEAEVEGASGRPRGMSIDEVSVCNNLLGMARTTSDSNSKDRISPINPAVVVTDSASGNTSGSEEIGAKPLSILKTPAASNKPSLITLLSSLREGLTPSPTSGVGGFGMGGGGFVGGSAPPKHFQQDQNYVSGGGASYGWSNGNGGIDDQVRAYACAFGGCGILIMGLQSELRAACKVSCMLHAK